MAFMLKQPFIYIIVGVIFIVLLIGFSGIFAQKPAIVTISPSLVNNAITMNQNTTLTVVIKNNDQRSYTAKYRIIGTFRNDQLQFYYKVNSTLLPNPIYNGQNYTITYPETWLLNIAEERSVSVYIKGLDPKVDSATYTIFVEVFADNVLTERKSIQLTVRRT